MIKRLISVFLTLLIALSLFGCSPKENEEPVTIVWYIPGDYQRDIDLINEKASEITMEKIGVKLRIEFIDLQSFGDRMAMNFADGNDEFDLTFTGYVNLYHETAMQGAYVPLDDYIEKSDVIKNVVPDYVLEASRKSGHIYAVANMQVLTSNTGLFILKDLADEYGLETEKIKYVQDIEPFLKWVKENHPEIYPFRTRAVGGGFEENYPSDSFGSCVNVTTDENGRPIAKTLLEENKRFIEYKYLNKWYEMGYIRQDVSSVVADEKEKHAGRYAVWRGIYKPGGDMEHNAAHPESECIMIKVSNPVLSINVGSNTMTAINAKSKHPDEAFKIIELANSDKEFYNLLCYGIEGVHYDFDETGRVVYRKNSGYMPNASWKFGSVFNSYLLPGQPDDLWEQTKKYNDSAARSGIQGFYFDEFPVRLQITKINWVNEKYRLLKDDGTVPLEEWYPNYLKELEDAGMSIYKEELQRQLDIWYAEKNKE